MCKKFKQLNKFNVDDVVVGINDIFKRSVDLMKIYHKIKGFCSERFNLVL